MQLLAVLHTAGVLEGVKTVLWRREYKSRLSSWELLTRNIFFQRAGGELQAYLALMVQGMERFVSKELGVETCLPDVDSADPTLRRLACLHWLGRIKEQILQQLKDHLAVSYLWGKGRCSDGYLWARQDVQHQGQACGRQKDSNMDSGCWSAGREQQVQGNFGISNLEEWWVGAVCWGRSLLMVSGTASWVQHRERKWDTGWYLFVLLTSSLVTRAGGGKKEWWQIFSSSTLADRELLTPFLFSSFLRDKNTHLFSPSVVVHDFSIFRSGPLNYTGLNFHVLPLA